MDSQPDAAEPLQFDTAAPKGALLNDAAERNAVTCTACQRTIADEYFDVNGQPVCDPCRGEIARHAETPRAWGVFVRAILFGIGAAIAGAILYYAVIAITDFEIGIVAIAIGYMVGYGIRMATKGRGGLRFQIAAVVLTYWAVGLAYTPLVFRGMSEQDQQAAQASASSGDSTDAAGAPEDLNVPVAVAYLTALSFALPVMMVLGSLPGGLISAAIIAFGMQQAWRMTGSPQVQISGPYRIGAAPAALA